MKWHDRATAHQLLQARDLLVVWMLLIGTCAWMTMQHIPVPPQKEWSPKHAEAPRDTLMELTPEQLRACPPVETVVPMTRPGVVL